MAKFHSKWNLFYRLLLMISILAIVGFIYFKVDIYLTNQKIAINKDVIAQQDEELAQFSNNSGYARFLYAQKLDLEIDAMNWSDRINKVADMLDDLRRVDGSQSETIELSDFVVGLDKISLRGTVSNLALLYYNSNSGYKSLLDRFEELDFIRDMEIKTYEKKDWNYEFVLEANVINDDK